MLKNTNNDNQKITDIKNSDIDNSYTYFINFFLGQLLSLLGSSMSSFVLIWWITEVTRSALILGISSFLAVDPSILLTPFAGVIADLWDRKKIIGISDSLQAVTVIFLIIAFISNLEESTILITILVTLAIKGILQAFHQPAFTSLIPTMISKEKIQQFNSWNYLG
ncbi:MAG: MFS transporter, partial [Candidatus Hodarchaeales archaeon]